MSWLARVRNVFRGERVTSDIERELAFHLAQLEDDLVAAGKSRSEARREARRRFGNLTMQSERTRQPDVIAWLDNVVSDARYALRGLRNAPAFALVAVLSLALGIGANTAIFTLLNVVLFKTLPVSHPEELVQITDSSDPNSKNASSFNSDAWRFIREHQEMFSGVFAYGSTGSGDLSTGGESRPISVGLVSGAFYTTLGVRPAAGRLLGNGDDYDGCPGTVVLTHAFWSSEFGADASAIRKPLLINGHAFEIVGVAEPRFFGLGFGYYPPVWMPQCAGKILRGPGYEGGGNIIGRLKPGVSLSEARAHVLLLGPGILDATLPRLSPEEARQYRNLKFDAEPFTRGFRFLEIDYGSALLVLMAIVGIVLLIACANVANLMLARATARQREIAIRVALGASRRRLLGQFVSESLLLSCTGALVGVLLATWGSHALVELLSRRGRPLLTELSPDLRVLGFTFAATILCALIFGPAPAWRALRVNPQDALRAGGRGIAEGHSRFHLGKSLIVAQLALALVMTAATGLLVGSWRRLATLDPGFESGGVALVRVNARAEIPQAQMAATYRAILERLRTIPGVDVASAADRTPIGTTSWTASIETPNAAALSPDARTASLNEVSEHYFATMGIRLLSGRDFDHSDGPNSHPAAIVSAEFARRFLGTASPLGKSFTIRWDHPVTYDIVGVVADTKDQQLWEQALPIAYLSLTQDAAPEPYFNFLARTQGDPATLLPLMRAAIREAHPRLALTSITLRDQMNDSLRLQRTLGVLSAFCTGLALLLASIGLYGIMAYSVARRRNEIGVRIALGANRVRILRMVLGDVARLLLTGLLIGSSVALATQRLMTSFLFGVGAGDPTTLIASAFALSAVALLAAALPAWRAARLDPLSALRES